MTAYTEILQQLSGVDEVAWGEASTDMTGAQIYPIAARIDFSGIARAMIDSPRVVSYKDEKPVGIPGAWMDAQFTIELELAGHGSTTSGSVSGTALAEIVAWAIGKRISSPASGTTCSATGTAVALTSTASATFAAGEMFRCGAANDGRGGGQWNNVASHVLTTLTGKRAFLSPPDNGDVIYGAETIYTVSSASQTTLTSKRFRALTPDFQAVLHGCFPKAWSLSGLGPGEVAHLTITVGVSWAEPISTTFPDSSSTAPWTYNPSVVAAGSVSLQAYGTASYGLVTARSVTIEVTTGISMEKGYNTVSGAQVYTGAKRAPDTIKVTAILASAGPSASPTYYDAWAAATPYHMMLSLSIGAGQALGIYFRRLIWAGKQPTQVGHDGLNAVALEFLASSDSTGATEQAKAAMVLGLG